MLIDGQGKGASKLRGKEVAKLREAETLRIFRRGGITREMTKNPYKAKIQSVEASLPGKVEMTLADLFRYGAKAWQEGFDACKQERECEMLEAAQGDNAGQEMHLEE